LSTKILTSQDAEPAKASLGKVLTKSL